MAWFALSVFVYLLMIFVTRVVYEASLDEKSIPRWRHGGGRMDDARFLLPIIWPIGLPLMAGDFFGKVLRKGLEIINSQEN